MASKAMIVFVVVMSLGVLTQSMHLHPRLGTPVDESKDPELSMMDVDKVSTIDVQQMNSARLVPLNSAFFFKLNSPCEDGYQRDFLGICREVW